MRILLFGGSGQLGYEVIQRARSLNFEIVAPHETEVDLADAGAIVEVAKRQRPEIVINCAAYTAVDKAEKEQELAFKVNCDGAANAALGAATAKARMIHISTDYVFAGDGNSPLKEDAPTNPLNVYGASKLAGEKKVLEILGESRAAILRTQSLHGSKGANFVHTMLRLFAERETIRVVQDQTMCATYAGWLAEVILDVARVEASGIYHASCRGPLTWYEFTCGIWEQVAARIKRNVKIEPCSSTEYPVAAKRPAYSAFDCSKLAAVLGREPITWQQGLRQHLSEIGY